jgi:3-hydroxymyristoyl/3-hydroxydecanoyl-(acyl carrier protein) dehydratase
MTDHFAAFSFVDRITEYEPAGARAGRYDVPADIGAFPVVRRRRGGGSACGLGGDGAHRFPRPARGGARETKPDFCADVCPGDTLDLAVDIESCNEETVAYGGEASVGGKKAIQLVDCLAPMLPVEEFGLPPSIGGALETHPRRRRAVRAIQGVASPTVVRTAGERGVSAAGVLSVPDSAPFFGDHFPRRPVFPATLLLDAQIRFALELAAEATFWPAGTRPAPARMTHVKMRSFIPPGVRASDRR